MPNVNPNNGTYEKVALTGYAFWTDADTVVPLDPTVDISADPLYNFIGELSAEGLTESDNPDEPEATKGKSGEVWFQPAATTAPTLSFTFWELYNAAAAQLMVHEDALIFDTVDVNRCLGWDEPAAAPVAKKLVFDSTTNEGVPERLVYHYTTYVSRERVSAEDEPVGYTVTLSVKNHPTTGKRISRRRAA